LDYGVYRRLDVKGFNVYRRAGTGAFERLNARAIVVSADPGQAEAEGLFVDAAFDPSVRYAYAVAPVDLFGAEGVRVEAVYDPVLAASPSAPQVTAATRDTTGAVVLVWAFPAEQEGAVSGFVVERADPDMPDDARAVSPLLRPATRSFADTTATETGVYYG